MTSQAAGTARAAGEVPLTAATRELLSVRLGAHDCGIDILQVREIRSYESPTRVPHLPQAVKGVINLRGQIVPIVDLRVVMDCADCPYDNLTAVVVLELRGRTLGVVVDAVNDVLAAEPARHEAASTANLISPYFSGSCRSRQHSLCLLDLDGLWDATAGASSDAAAAISA